MKSNEPQANTATTEQDSAKEAVDKAKDAAKRQGERLTESARSAMDDAQEAATEQAEKVRSRAADDFEQTARALESAAQELDAQSMQRELFDRGAAGLHEFARTVRDKNLGDLVNDVARFGRSNPGMFLGGAALAGFALARFGVADVRPETSAGAGVGQVQQHTRVGQQRTGAATVGTPTQPLDTPARPLENKTGSTTDV